MWYIYSMAINYIEPDSNQEDKVTFEITNGHFKSLKKITNDFNIDSEALAFAFMLSVVEKANGNPITIDGETLVPSDSIKKNQTDS